MRNIILLILCMSFASSFSQTEEQMLEAGIKKGTVKLIMKKFDGEITAAVNKWASSGNSKLSKKFVQSAKKLGYDSEYLDSSLKQARKNRLAQGIAGALVAGTAIALSQADMGGGGSSLADGAGTVADSYSLARSSNTNSSNSFKTDSLYKYDTSTIGIQAPSTYGVGVQPSSGETTIYGQNQYGFDTEVGSMKDDGYGNTTVYGKNEYGFDTEVGSMKDDGYGNTTVYGKNEYGFDTEVGSMKDDGFGNTIVYGKNEYGFDVEVRKYVKNNNGGFDIMEKNQYGFWKKVGSVKKIPR